ncbi:hypothetical protein [Bacillus licheniformis]|nr:hypothetical protein [Bacillus licheniformis]MCM3212023.1 hypothetical protein [Bacillus licheniformis]MCM3287956.1 hypothetical protein [Bacillus licheniformis]
MGINNEIFKALGAVEMLLAALSGAMIKNQLGCVSIRAPMMGGNPPAPESLWGPFQTTGPKDVVFQVKPSHTVKAYEKV